MVLFTITGTSIKDQYPIRANPVVLGSISKLIMFSMMLCYSNLTFIRSKFIDTDTCPRALLQIVCGPFRNWSYRFSCPAGLRKVVAMVPVGCAYLPSVIDQF